MTTDQDQVLAAVHRFYAALEDILAGRGAAAMAEAWHHTPEVTSGHPTGQWATGWDEVWATWELFASLGRPEGAGSAVRDLEARVYGDVAYTIGTFFTAPSFGRVALSITNVLHRVDGQWKIVHHHADRSREVEKGYERVVVEG